MCRTQKCSRFATPFPGSHGRFVLQHLAGGRTADFPQPGRCLPRLELPGDYARSRRVRIRAPLAAKEISEETIIPAFPVTQEWVVAAILARPLRARRSQNRCWTLYCQSHAEIRLRALPGSVYRLGLALTDLPVSLPAGSCGCAIWALRRYTRTTCSAGAHCGDGTFLG